MKVNILGEIEMLYGSFYLTEQRNRINTTHRKSTFKYSGTTSQRVQKTCGSIICRGSHI